MEIIRPFPASPPLPKRSFFFQISSTLTPKIYDQYLGPKVFKICKTNSLLTIVFVNTVWISSCNKDNVQISSNLIKVNYGTWLFS